MSDQKRKGDDLPALDGQESKRQKMAPARSSQKKKKKKKKKKAEAAAALSPDHQVALTDAIQKEGEIRNEIKEITRKYKRDIALANSKLRATKRKIEKARIAIRSSGEAEYDSLLSLKMDSITHMLGYLDIRSLGRCEVASRRLKQAAAPAWEAQDKRVGPPQNRSAESDERTRAIRFHLASKYAQMCEPWIKKHNDYDYNNIDYRYAHSNDGYCKQYDPYEHSDESDEEEVAYDDAGCCFPDELNSDIFKRSQDFEVFIRVTQANGGNLYFEGFIPSDHIKVEPRENRENDPGDTPTLAINFLGLNFPNWPGMNRCLSLNPIQNREEWLPLSQDMFHYGDDGRGIAMDALMTTIIAIEKGKPVRTIKEMKLGLLAAFCEYQRNEDEVYIDGTPYDIPFEYVEIRHYFRVEGRIPASPHDGPDADACRFLWFAWSKSDPGKFAGLLIEDGSFRDISLKTLMNL